MSQFGDLERIRLDVDAELALVQASRRLDLAGGTTAEPRFDDSDVEAYEARLHTLHDSVLVAENLPGLPRDA